MNTCQIENTENGFKILGLINFETVMQVYKQGIALLDRYKEVRLDFADVVHADSSAIALLLNWLRFAKKKQKTFVFVNLPSQLVEIANVCEVMPILNQYLNEGSK